MAMTLKDIAKLCGVSTATVSKVINGKDSDIGAPTIERIRAIVKELDYHPNSLARSMKTKVTKTIGLIIPDVRNPFFTDLARGAEDNANERGYSLLFCNTDDDLNKEMEYIKTLSQKQVDGIALAGAVSRDRALEEKFPIEIPIVTLDRNVYYKGLRGFVHTDNQGGAHDGVRYLISLGHRRILFLSGFLDLQVSIQRLAGYKQALADHGIPFDPELVADGPFTSDFGSSYIMSGKLDESVTAIFCGNDLIALGAIKALKQLQKKVPEDISIMGFDDIYLASLNSPELTTIHQPSYELGYVTVGRLIDILEGVPLQEDRVEIKLDLVIRETTARPVQQSNINTNGNRNSKSNSKSNSNSNSNSKSNSNS